MTRVNRRVRRGAAASFLGLALLVAGCGDDDETDSDETETTADDAADSPATTRAAATPTTAADDDAATTTAGDDGANDDATTVAEGDGDTTETVSTETVGGFEGDVPDLTEECEELAGRLDIEDAFTEGNFGDVADAMDELKELTPDEIDADIDTLTEAYRDMAEIVEESGGNITEIFSDPEVMQKFEELNTVEVQGATERIDAFFEAAGCSGVGES